MVSLSLDKADARIGRPLTPMSVAGVNRRVHRRAYYGAAAGAAAAGAVYYNSQRCGYYAYLPCYYRMAVIGRVANIGGAPFSSTRTASPGRVSGLPSVAAA